MWDWRRLEHKQMTSLNSSRGAMRRWTHTWSWISTSPTGGIRDESTETNPDWIQLVRVEFRFDGWIKNKPLNHNWCVLIQLMNGSFGSSEPKCSGEQVLSVDWVTVDGQTVEPIRELESAGNPTCVCFIWSINPTETSSRPDLRETTTHIWTLWSHGIHQIRQ